MLSVVEIEQLPVAEARSGHASAWRALFRRYRLPLYTYVYELVRDEQASLDLVQESFVRAVRHLPTLRDNAKFGSWLFGIAHQQCLRRWRSPERAEFATETLDEIPHGDDDPAEMLVREERVAEVRRRIAQLPSPQRAVLVLFALEDFSLEDIARVTGAPLGTVKSRLFHAKRALKQLLEKSL